MSGVRAKVPKWLKRPVKRALMSHQLTGAIRKIANLPEGQTPNRQLLSELLAGWGNQGYAANLEYFEEVAKLAVGAQQPVLECGSGATTFLLGLLCGRRGVEVWSLEHSAEWQERVRDVLTRNRISGVRVCFSPLIGYGDFDWYQAPLTEMPDEFSFVVCDGPPGSTRGGRYGLLPVLGNRLPVGATILLDDTCRSSEAELIKRWGDEASFEVNLVETQGHGFAIMRRCI